MGIALGDGTTKIFLNTDSELEDVNKELRVFLDYVRGKSSDDPFIQRVDEAVREARKNREWRREYMTLLMRDQENIEKGIEQGIEKGIKKGIEKGRIYGMITAFREVGMSEDVILKKLMEKFHLAEAESYLQETE